jgi:hypothetical protein
MWVFFPLFAYSYMVSEPEMDSSTSSVLPMPSAPDFSPAKTHLPDISIKLASNNYLLWKAQVIPILRGHGLLGYITNDISCPDSTIAGADGTLQPNPAAATWLRTDQLILGWINSSLSDGPLSQVINSESYHYAWIFLETLNGSHTRDHIQQIKGELQTLSKGSYSLEDYLHRAKSLALSLRGAGKPMGDNDLIVCILCGLGSEFDPIVAALNARDMFPSLEGVISKLRDFESGFKMPKLFRPILPFTKTEIILIQNLKEALICVIVLVAIPKCNFRDVTEMLTTHNLVIIPLEQNCLHSPVQVAALVADEEVSPVFTLLVQITKLMVVLLQMMKLHSIKLLLPFK